MLPTHGSTPLFYSALFKFLTRIGVSWLAEVERRSRQAGEASLLAV